MKRSALFSMLLVVSLVAVVVGGTYAVFSDTEGTHVLFQAGAIDITVDSDLFDGTDPFYINPDGFNDWKPGDKMEVPITITNPEIDADKGIPTNPAWVQIYVYKTKAWDEGRPEFWDVATLDWTVSGVPVPSEEWNQWELLPGEVLELTAIIDFPQWVGNDYEGAQGDLAILVVAKQVRNKLHEGYQCVALENKDSDWYPILGDPLEGIVCYKAVDGDLLVDVNAYGLKADTNYQLTLEGTGAGATLDNFEDVSFAGMSGDLFVSGWTDFAPGYLLPAPSQTWHEGVYNFAGVYDPVTSTAGGSLSYGGTISGLPAGTYDQVKFIIKEVTGDLPGTAWTPVLMEMDFLNFVIPAP